MVRSANALYVNTGSGKFSAEWAAVTNNADVTDTDAKPGDFMMKDLEQFCKPLILGRGLTQALTPSTDGLWIEDSGKLYPSNADEQRRHRHGFTCK